MGKRSDYKKNMWNMSFLRLLLPKGPYTTSDESEEFLKNYNLEGVIRNS